jgi:hypothetical protein
LDSLLFKTLIYAAIDVLRELILGRIPLFILLSLALFRALAFCRAILRSSLSFRSRAASFLLLLYSATEACEALSKTRLRSQWEQKIGLFPSAFDFFTLIRLGQPSVWQ